MNTTQELAVREQDEVPAYRPIVEVATDTSRSVEEEPAAPPRRLRHSHPLTYVRRILQAICDAGQPATTPQVPLVLPNGAVTWTPYAMDTPHRPDHRDDGGR